MPLTFRLKKLPSKLQLMLVLFDNRTGTFPISRVLLCVEHKRKHIHYILIKEVL